MSKHKIQKQNTFWQYFKNRDTIFATISVFVVMGLLALIPINTHFLDPVKMALNDFDYSDLAFSKMGKNKNAQLDTNIVIIDIGNADRKQIVELIENAKAQKAKLIGVDVLFEQAKDSVADLELKALFKNNSNIVMAYRLNQTGNNLSRSGYFYNEAKNKGFVNFVAEDIGVIRNFQPFIKEGNYNSFSASILREFNTDAYQKLIDRGNEIEIINYSRKADKFLVVSASDLLNKSVQSSVLAQKIVLLGYISPSVNNIEDKHYTPLNSISAGKGLPDLNGVFIHANILSMEINKAYINKSPSWINWLIAFVVCWVHMAFFIKYVKEGHMWFHLKAKIASIIMAVLFIYFGLWFFYYFDIKLSMTATMVAVLLAIDVLYFYESFAMWLNKKWGYKTIFNHEAH